MQAIQIIQDEHRKLWRVASTINIVADEMDAGSPVPTPFFHAVFDYIEGFIDHAHHPKEDDFLFRLLRQRSDKAEAVLLQLEANHQHGPATLRALRNDLARAAQGNCGAFTAALRSYTKNLEEHIRTEERDILPLAREVLLAEDWALIDKAFAANDDPLFGKQATEQYRELYHRIVALAPESVGLGSQSAGQLKPEAPSKADVLLAIKGMDSHYGRIQALKGLSMEVRRGETVALVGANGAGKTTFLRTLSGVQPMSAGRIYFDGADISKLRSDLRMRTGICQSPEGRQVFGPLSIEDNLRLGAYTQPKTQVEGDMEKVFGMFPILKE